MNLFYDNEYETVTTTCPQCGTSVEQDYRAFLHAINFEEGFMCHDCKCNYAITTVLLDPRSPTLRAPVHAAIELLYRIKRHQAVWVTVDTEWLMQEVDAVLKTAAGG